MHDAMPFWMNPAIVVIEVFAGLCLILLAGLGVQKLLSRRKPPSLPPARVNPLPPADTAIEEIRREVEASEQRSLERDWIRDGEIVLRPKCPKR